MPLFTYNRDIPAANNNPSVDQPNMLTNTNSADDLIDVDHYSFNESNGGLHRQVQMPTLGAVSTLPAGLIAGEGTLYTNTDPSPASAVQLFYTPANTGNSYQLTKVITASYSLFGTNTNNYNGVGTNFTGGWTFLPGGLVYQYGTYRRAAGISPSSITVTFPVAFTSSSSITVLVSPTCASGGTSQIHVASVEDGSIGTTSFICNFDTSTTSYVGFTWIAIGK